MNSTSTTDQELSYSLVIKDAVKENQRLFARFMQGEIESFTVVRDGSKAVFWVSERCKKSVVKIG